MSYECPYCDTTTQWSCDCWQYEAATYSHGAAAGQDCLDQLRREWQRERDPRGGSESMTTRLAQPRDHAHSSLAGRCTALAPEVPTMTLDHESDCCVRPRRPCACCAK
jgi:hypothetical protein